MQNIDIRNALVVEDDEAISAVFQRFLSLWGWRVDIAPSIKGALELFGQNDYALAICDVNVGNGDGITLSERLRASCPSLLIIITSGNPLNLKRARQMGFSRCLRKPFVIEELKAAIH